MQNMAHDHHICLRELCVREEIAGVERGALCQAVCSNVLVKDRPDRGEVVAYGAQIGVDRGDLGDGRGIS